MNGWYYFWLANFVLAGSAFAVITLIVRTYSLHSPWKEDRQQENVRVTAGARHAFSLKPFGVLVLEGAPAK